MIPRIIGKDQRYRVGLDRQEEGVKVKGNRGQRVRVLRVKEDPDRSACVGRFVGVVTNKQSA